MVLSQAMGAEFRRVDDVEHQGQPGRAVEGSRIYSTDLADLWDAVTNPERLPRWFLPVTGDLKPGGRYQLEGNAGGTITRCEPPKSFEVTWEIGGNTSWVRVVLTEQEEGTRLTLIHTMLKDEASEAHWATYGPGATGVGWDLSFLGLAMFVDGGGETLDQEAVYAWMADDEGKAFIRSCAEAWGVSHIEAGEEAEIAHQMAAATGGFYTGE